MIDHLDIDLLPGFSVITGETGAGKSIILGAIGLLLGERADHAAIKNGERRCVIEAEFDVEGLKIEDFFNENDLDFDGKTCIIRREISANGKSRAFVNDTPVVLTKLKELGDQLIDIHSQHQNLLLGKEDYQLNVLDLIARNADETDTYSKLFRHYKQVCRNLEAALSHDKESKEEEDFLRYQAEQLAETALTDGEQEMLEEEQEVLSHAEDIKQNLYAALSMLRNDDETDTLQSIKQGITSLESVANVFAPAAELAERMRSCYVEMQDIADEIGRKADDIDCDHNRLSAVEDRLNTIYTLLKKHRVETVAELIKLQKDIEEKLELIDRSDEIISSLTREKADALAALTAQAALLTDTRRKAKAHLEGEITDLLQSLGMPNVTFEVDMTPRSEPDSSGMDKVSFYFSANKNVPPQPLSQIASGGEIARVMLSLKALTSVSTGLPTIIFDEIDTGVSGNIAERMAVIMGKMAEQGRQVISITHLPQIAARGKHHYKVYKEDGLFATTTHITPLKDEQRVEEIAHMLSGATISEAAMNNAKALLRQDN